MNPTLLTYLSLTLAAASQESESSLSLKPQEFRVSERLTYQGEVGTLSVRENREQESSRRIELAVVRLKSTAARPGAPILHLTGGPGGPATPLADNDLWAAFLEIGDVILLDQRGCGQSRPELSFATPSLEPAGMFESYQDALEHSLEIAELAAEHFREQGVDLSCYQTRESAADVDELRTALSCPRISLLGHSYGTHLGLEVVRRFGHGIDRFVSIGTSGTNDMHQLPADLDERVRRLSRIVAQDPRIGAAMPDFHGALEELLAQLELDPLEVEIAGADGKRVSVVVGKFGMQAIVLRDLGDTSDLPVLPRLVHSVLQGDKKMLAWFLQKRYGGFATFPTLLYVNRASSGATAERWQKIEEQAPGSLFGLIRCMFCPEIEIPLGVRDLGDEFRAPVHSDVPALFVSGTLDANTPPEMAEAVRAGFPNGRHLIVENGGHEDLLGHPEVLKRVLAFLRHEEVVDQRLAAPPIRFALLEGPDPSVGHPSLRASGR